MNEKVRKSIVYAIFVAAVIWGYFNIFGGKNKNASTAAFPTPNVRQASSDSVSDSTVPEISAVVIDSLENKPWGRNPFYNNPPRVVNPHPVRRKIALKVQGILYREVGAQAFVNNRIVKVGDLIEGYHVVAINKDYIVVKDNDREYKLPVTKESS